MAFGAVALFLASVGLYGVMSFVVARRTQEMGIRTAMGAKGGELVKLMLKKGVVQLAIGLVIGLGIAALAAGPLQFVLFEANPRDPFVFGAVVVTLSAVGVLASFIPASHDGRYGDCADAAVGHARRRRSGGLGRPRTGSAGLVLAGLTGSPAADPGSGPSSARSRCSACSSRFRSTPGNPPS